jgi:gamma-glutamyltranspeptidase/glutathione hydrolase
MIMRFFMLPVVALLLGSMSFPLDARQGAVAASDEHGSDAGAAVLRAGGNAVDAAIATAFVLAVTVPEAGNIGGGGFMVSWMDGEAAFLDFREKAPLAASADMYLNAAGDVNANQSLLGGLSIGVPGTVQGLRDAHRRYGVLPWPQLLAPAINLAEEGFAVHPRLAALIRAEGEPFRGRTNFFDYFSELEAGALFKQPALAATLKRLARDPADFYRGETARQIIAQMKVAGGLITAQDLQQYRAVWREPLDTPWRGHRLLSPAPPSSGGIGLIQLLVMRDFAAPLFNNVTHNSARYVHLLAEIEKRVFADRGVYLGDPDFGDVPTAALTDRDYLRQRAGEINVEVMSPAVAVQPGLESRHTTHISVIDPRGNAVALTYTLNGDFGSGVVVEGGGFLLNNQMDDFSAKPNVPNLYGLVGNAVNAIEPGKRMLSSMTPAILLRNGEPAMVLGAMGGSSIFTTLFQIILNVLDFDMDASAALAATRFHHQLPAAVEIVHDASAKIPSAVVIGLQRFGYEVRPYPWGDIGEAQLILRDPAGQLDAAADPRGRGMSTVIEMP